MKDEAMELTEMADGLPIEADDFDRDIFFGIMGDFNNLFLYYFHDEFLKRSAKERQDLFKVSLRRIDELLVQIHLESINS